MMEKNIKCLVTGGAGFIGSHLCDSLISKGYNVYCVDNLITGNKKNIVHLLHNPHFHFILHDITIPLPTNYQLPITNYQFIYHLASPASPPQYQKYSIETLKVNSIGTCLMLEIAKKYGANFLLASTSEVYGDPLEHPQKETYYGNVNPTGVRACYDESKRFAEALTMEYVRKFRLKARIIRIFNTYGPRMQYDDGRVISNFVTRAISGRTLTMFGNGNQTRSFCYVADMVEGLILAMEKDLHAGTVINMGYPKEHTIKEIAKIILKLTKSSSVITLGNKQEDDPQRRKPDITKSRMLLGWQPKTPLSDGLSETIKYFRDL